MGRPAWAGLACALAAACAATGVLVASDPPRRGVIRGVVEVRREPAATEDRPAVAHVGAPAAHAAPDRRRSVVYLDSAPRGAFELRDTRAVMDQRGQMFVPHVLAVTAGSTVDFKNSDDTYHNVFSFSKGNRFDLGRYGRGRSKSVRFDRVGVVRVFCDIHSHMSAFILVFGHRYFATTDAEGRYQIDYVPAGDYRLVAWNEGQVRESREVVGPAGGAVEVNFVLK